MANKYDSDDNRKKALKRAKKIGKILGDEGDDKGQFAAIMKAVDPVFVDLAFNQACAAAKLDAYEITWLKTYLKQCNAAVYDTLPEAAAATGW